VRDERNLGWNQNAAGKAKVETLTALVGSGKLGFGGK
jgi:hypothetical protein